MVWCHVTPPTAIYFHLTPGLNANTQVIFNLRSNTFSWLKIQIKIKKSEMLALNPHLLEGKPTTVISPPILKFRFWSQHQKLIQSVWVSFKKLSYLLFKRSQKKAYRFFKSYWRPLNRKSTGSLWSWRSLRSRNTNFTSRSIWSLK